MIRVLIVEDSAVVREFLSHVLSSDPEIEVVGAAQDGEEAVEFAKQKKPHVITMDIAMPKMDGFEATRRIMESFPTPIIIVSASSDAWEVEKTFRAMEAGAVAVLPKPRGRGRPGHDLQVQELIQTVKLMSEVKVVKRWPRRGETALRSRGTEIAIAPTAARIETIAIGASTGGPVPIQTILSNLPADFPAAVLIVQHIASGFTPGFVEWLADSSRLPVRLARDGEQIENGRAYVAPDEHHMGVRSDRRIELSRDAPENGMRPSVSYLFRSVAKACGGTAVGVLLSGMGKDGAGELRLMRDAGAITFAQDEASTVVYGMPGEAARLGAVVHSLPPEQIAAALASMVNETRKRGEKRT